MKKKQGFTLIELLAVIVILAVIALIATPLIMGTIAKAKKNAFKDTAYGILKAGEKYTAEILLESENTYSGETIELPEANHNKKLNYKGQEPKGGQMRITRAGNISLVIYNDSWCVIKNATDKDVKIEKYNEEQCKLEVSRTGIMSEVIVNLNMNNNQEGIFLDDYGNTRYRGSNDEVKNYVTFNNELWRIIGVFDGKVKLIRNESIGEMKWNETKNNNWDTSTLKAYLNGEYYNSLNATGKNQIEASTYHLGGPSHSGMYANAIYEKERENTVYNGNPITTNQNIGLMYPSDYGYAARNACINVKKMREYENSKDCTEGNWLYQSDYEWLLTPINNNEEQAFYIESSGSLENHYNYQVTRIFEVRPVVYLKPTIEIYNGDGTISNPYIIE